MSLKVRRVITGHDADGRAVVKIDEIAKNVRTGRPGAQACVIWSTNGFPVNNDTDMDPSAVEIGLGCARDRQLGGFQERLAP